MLIRLELYDGGEVFIETKKINSIVNDNAAGCLLITLNNGEHRVRATMDQIQDGFRTGTLPPA